MITLLRASAVLVALLWLNGLGFAADATHVPEAQRTTLGLYLNAEQVLPFLAAKRGQSLFVDVRTPAELTSTGVATMIDANAASLLASGADAKLQPNPDFVATVESQLTAKGLAKSDAVVLICRTGVRSARAANVLAAAGFSQVYIVVDGFQGDGSSASGWKNKGLPWRTP